MQHVKKYKTCVFYHKQRIIMTSEAVLRALLGIILETLEENSSKNKTGKTRKCIRRKERASTQTS